MIDTARAARAGTLGSLMYPCPIDRRCQSLLGIDAASFDAVAYEHELRSRRESHQSVRVDAQETTIGTRRGR